MTTPSATPTPDEGLPKEGDILAGKYRIEKVLGEGGMGLVVAAQHTTLRQKVAIKLLLPEAAQRKDATERFLREARAASSIQSEHVARVSDVGTLANGLPYMVMEFLTGQDLSDFLENRAALPIADAVDYLLQACEAIAEAHSLGIIHRDLKPANLFLSQRADGSSLVKVLDFGLSKATGPGEIDGNLTAVGVVMGSPCYMSPEQVRSLKGLDARTDIWALGVILYQLLTGARPFDSPSLGGLFVAISGDAPKPPREHRPEIPPELEAAVLRCLEKDISRRTQTVAELARSIAPFGKQDSFISVERIHRVLNDPTPMSAPGRPSGVPPQRIPSAVSLEEVDDGAATVLNKAAPYKPESLRPPPGGQPPSSLYPPPPPGYPGGYPQAPGQAGGHPPGPGQAGGHPQAPGQAGEPPQVKSGSMAAVARDGSSPPSAAAPPQRSPMVWVALALAILAVGGAAGVGLSKLNAPAPTPATTGDPPAQTPAPVSPPPATVATTAVPQATALPTATAAETAAVAPSTSASTKPPVPVVKGPMPKKK